MLSLLKSAAPAWIQRPIKRGLEAVGVDSAISKAIQIGGRDVPHTPHLFMRSRGAEELKNIGQSAGAKAIKHISENPDVALAAAIPFPGSVPLYMGAKRLAHNLFKRAMLDSFSPLEKLAEVQPYQQLTQHTCSAACLKAVLSSYGVDYPEEEIAQAIGVRPRYGAETDQLRAGAEMMGFEAFEYGFSTLDQAKSLLDADIPIICDFQSFNHPGKGHYVVLTKIDGDACHIMDPNTPGNQRVLTREHLEARWWDRAMTPPHRLMEKWGIIVLPPEGV